MAWLLDTNAWIHHLKNPGGPIEQRLNQLSPAESLLCSVVKAELWHGALKMKRDIGIDRLCMMLLGQENIRDVILFPQLKPK